MKHNERILLPPRSSSKESYYFTDSKFTIMYSWDYTLGALSNWLAEHFGHPTTHGGPLNFNKSKIPHIEVQSGGGTTWVAMAIIQLVQQYGGIFTVRVAYSSGCYYAMARNANLDHLIGAHTHPASNDNYKTPEEKAEINSANERELTQYKHLFRDEAIDAYLTLSRKHFSVTKGYKRESLPLDKVWVDVTNIVMKGYKKPQLCYMNTK